MTQFRLPISVFFVFLLSACASVKTYSDADLKNKTGILYYPPKPYVLVSHTGAKDKPRDIEVVYLPDLSQPRYVVMKSGFGSSKLALNFSNGVLVSTSQEGDPKIVEAITALAGVPGALANAANAAETSMMRLEAGEIPQGAEDAEWIAGDLRALAQDPVAKTILSASELSTIEKRLPGLLDGVAQSLRQSGDDAQTVAAALRTLQNVRQELGRIASPDNPSEGAADFWGRLRRTEKNLDDLIAKAKPKEAPVPILSLYEVIIENGETRLLEVPLSTLDGAVQAGAEAGKP